MRKMKWLLLVLLVTPLFGVNDYYVSASGSDSNPGTVGSPWLTIQHARSAATVGSSGSCVAGSGWVTEANAGACIHVLSGSYGGIGTVSSSGSSSSQRIVIVAENRWGPVFTNPNVTENGSHTAWVGLNMTGPTQASVIVLASGTDRTVEYNYIHDVSNSSCGLNGVIHETTAPSSSDVINGNVIRHFGSATACSGGSGFHGIYADGSGLKITNNIISGGSGGWAIQKQYAGITDCTPGFISNNTIFNNAGGIVINDEGNSCAFNGWVISNNIIINNGVSGTGGGGSSSWGIDYYNMAGTPTVTNNLVYGNLPGNYAKHGNACTPGSSGCPASNQLSDSGTSVTFINFRSDTNSSPDSSYNYVNYKLGGTSQATSGGTSTGRPAADIGVQTRTINTAGAWTFASVSGTNYYVATNGSDTTGDGSSGSPWKSITHAASSASLGSTGTTVNVAQGTYNECVFTNKTGTQNQRIKYVSTSYLGAKIVCDGSGSQAGQLSVWVNGTGSNTRTADYTTITGFEVTSNTPTTRCSGISNFGSFAIIQYNYIHDILGQAQAGTGTCPNGGAGIELRNNGNPPTVQTHSLADGNIIDHIGLAPGGVTGVRCPTIHGIYVSSPQHTVTNNTITRACGWGIHIFHNTTQEVVANNVVVNNFNGGILNSASDGFTNNNSFFANNVSANNGPEGQFEEKYGPTSGTVYHNNAAWGSNTAYNFSNGSRTNTNPITTGSDSNFFNNYASGIAKNMDTTLKTGSPGIGAGYNGSCNATSPCIPTTDQVGNGENNPIDVGVRAYGGGSGPTPPPPTGLLTPTDIIFPTTNTGDTSAFVPIAVHNTSSVAVHFSSIAASTTGGGSIFALVTSVAPCPIGGGGLAAGASCEVDVTFSPAAAQSYTGLVTFTDDFVGSPSSPQTVTLSGQGHTPTAPDPPTGLTVEVR